MVRESVFTMGELLIRDVILEGILEGIFKIWEGNFCKWKDKKRKIRILDVEALVVKGSDIAL